jgi:hypothetical protein
MDDSFQQQKSEALAVCSKVFPRVKWLDGGVHVPIITGNLRGMKIDLIVGADRTICYYGRGLSYLFSCEGETTEAALRSLKKRIQKHTYQVLSLL